MALSEINFTTLNGGLGRTLAGDDATSGLVVDNTNQPADADKTLVVYSLKDAEGQGIAATGDTAEAHYHVAQFFAQVAAPLYITFSAGSLAADIQDLQSAAQGAIKQVAVADNAAFVTATLTTLQAAAATQIAAHEGLSILYGMQDAGTFTLSTLPDLSTFNLPNVSVVISADVRRPYSSVGASLGVLASAKVSENIGYVRKFNVVKGDEFDSLKFITGDLYKTIAKSLLNQLDGKGYIFLRKFTGKAGSFHSDSKTATSSTSDFYRIENTRSMEKAQRVIRLSLLDELNSPLTTGDGGKLTQTTIARFELLITNALEAMVAAGELSKFRVRIDPDQNILATSVLSVQVGLTPLGVAHFIEVEIGFEQ